jgi:hypothetical protein
MEVRKPWLAFCLTLVLIFTLAAGTESAILEKASQVLVLVQTLDNPVTLSALKRRLPSGEGAAYSLPANTAFIITRISWSFTAANASLNGDALFTIGNYFRAKVTLVNGSCGFSDVIPPGIPIADMSKSLKISLFGDPAQTPVPGTLALRLTGFTAPSN